jgi:hypothetical protein
MKHTKVATKSKKQTKQSTKDLIQTLVKKDLEAVKGLQVKCGYCY